MKKINLGNSSYFIGEELVIGSNFKIGKETVIRATKCVIGDYVTIGDDNKILVGETLTIGSNSFLGNKNDITCLSCDLGEYLFLDSNVIVGHGGKLSHDSRLKVGKHCMICAYVKLNVNFSIDIGDDVGIGEYVDVWTHGSFPPVLEGFPAQFGPVKIGNNVWLPAKSTVLANVIIGDNIVIGVNSLINKNLPSGCLAGGIPVKVLKENQYPVTDRNKNNQLVKEIIEEYKKQMLFKNPPPCGQRKLVAEVVLGFVTRHVGPIDAAHVFAPAEDLADEAFGRVPLAAAEGFIRQILGWREYVRGVYWANMPGYEAENYFGHQLPLPTWWWTGETKMRCLAHAIGQSLEHAYAHHIQRLMVIGNFALLAGLDPAALHRWYLGIYIDAFEWVELPNTVGMSQFADGGRLATKPYVSSAAYIDRMSDYCKGCHYDRKARLGERACPFNALYWDFFARNGERLSANPRLGMVYRQLARMSPAELLAAQGRALEVRARIEAL